MFSALYDDIVANPYNVNNKSLFSCCFCRFFQFFSLFGQARPVASKYTTRHQSADAVRKERTKMNKSG
jgi:hypothetical protein